MLKSPLFWKMTTLFGAVLLLLIPIMLIRQVIVERADYRSDVEDVIRQSTSGPQKLVGPLIAIPVTELYTVQEDDKTVERKRSFIHFWLPESLMVDGNQNVEERKIGIYTGQVWHSDLTLKADFDVSRLSELDAPNITLGKPFIVISVGDARGIGVVKAPEVNGTALTIEPHRVRARRAGRAYPFTRRGLAQAEPEAECGAEFKRYRRSFCGAWRA